MDRSSVNPEPKSVRWHISVRPLPVDRYGVRVPHSIETDGKIHRLHHAWNRDSDGEEVFYFTHCELMGPANQLEFIPRRRPFLAGNICERCWSDVVWSAP